MTLSPIKNLCRILGAILCVGSVAACDQAADDEKKVNVANAEANDKIAQANKDADQKIAAAQASFMKLREDYRHATTTNLVDLDRDVDNLAAKSKQASGQPRADMDARLQQIRASRTMFMKDYDSLEGATGATWDSTRVRLDKEWLDLKALVDKG